MAKMIIKSQLFIAHEIMLPDCFSWTAFNDQKEAAASVALPLYPSRLGLRARLGPGDRESGLSMYMWAHGRGKSGLRTSGLE